MPEMELVDSVPQAAPAAEPTPSPTPQEPVVETPAAAPAAEPVATPAPEAPVAVEPTTPQLFKLPDGREVDAAGLQKEYENLLPEFTRKSQELAALKSQPQPITTEEPAWKDPNYSPTTWAEAIEIAKQEALKELTANANEAAQQEAAVRGVVELQLAEIKATDPKVDENALFEHATKFGFTDLKSAHSNFKAMRDAIVATEQRVLNDVQKRSLDPIATTPTPPAAPKGNGVEPAAIGNFRGALDFLDSLKTKN